MRAERSTLSSPPVRGTTLGAVVRPGAPRPGRTTPAAPSFPLPRDGAAGTPRAGQADLPCLSGPRGRGVLCVLRRHPARLTTAPATGAWRVLCSCTAVSA
jgi:hypothetical protein